jgi:hypothetical protein
MGCRDDVCEIADETRVVMIHIVKGKANIKGDTFKGGLTLSSPLLFTE